MQVPYRAFSRSIEAILTCFWLADAGETGYPIAVQQREMSFMKKYPRFRWDGHTLIDDTGKCIAHYWESDRRGLYDWYVSIDPKDSSRGTTTLDNVRRRIEAAIADLGWG
jgi:hypothetical protein